VQRLFLWIKQLGLSAVSKLRELPHGSVLRDANEEKRNVARMLLYHALRFPGRQEGTSKKVQGGC